MQIELQIANTYKLAYEDHGKETLGGLMARVKRLDEAEAQAERLATLFQSYADSYVGDKGWDEAYEELAAYKEWRDGQG